jgi:hypothetical protein
MCAQRVETEIEALRRGDSRAALIAERAEQRRTTISHDESSELYKFMQKHSADILNVAWKPTGK